MSGQALVETAIVMPVLLTLLLGIIGVGFLFLSMLRMQNGVDVLAQLAAAEPGWETHVQSEDSRTACHADPLQPAVAYPDGSTDSGHRVELTWHCHLHTGWLFDGLPITVSSEAVIR